MPNKLFAHVLANNLIKALTALDVEFITSKRHIINSKTLSFFETC